VVIPVHDGERFLAAAIESALAQDYRRQEIVVVDDGSTDASAGIAAAYPVTLLRQPNAGVAGARNAGVAKSRGELIAFLDQDDLWLEHKISRQVALLADRPEAGFALTEMEIVLEPGAPRPEWLHESLLGRPMRAPIPSALMVRREAFEQIGGFDATYRMACDTDWLARAKDAGVESVMVEEPLFRYRIHASNEAHDRDTLFRELKLVLLASVRRQRAAQGAERA
jgi:glycosyltransferase involved in cell wall biosynthesis